MNPDCTPIVEQLQDEISSLRESMEGNNKNLADLHAKTDHLLEGVGVVYQNLTQVYATLTNLVNMLQAVQEVARMMPGGKRIAQAMKAQQGGNHRG